MAAFKLAQLEQSNKVGEEVTALIFIAVSLFNMYIA
jgi:hypothetical protein